MMPEDGEWNHGCLLCRSHGFLSLFSGFFMTGSMPEVSFPPVYGIVEPAAALSPERTLLFAVLREKRLGARENDWL